MMSSGITFSKRPIGTMARWPPRELVVKSYFVDFGFMQEA